MKFLHYFMLFVTFLIFNFSVEALMLSNRRFEKGPKARRKCKHKHCHPNEVSQENQNKLAYQLINEDLEKQARAEDERLKDITITETITDPDETNQISLSSRSDTY